MKDGSDTIGANESKSDEITNDSPNAATSSSTFRTSVIAGVISSLLFVLLVQPLVIWSWNRISPIVSSVYSGYVDSIYKSAALGHRHWVSVIIYSLMNGLIVGIMAGLITAIVTPKSWWRIDKSSKTPRRLKTRRFLRLGLYVSFFLMIVSSFMSVSRAYIDLQLNTSFEQRLNILAPSISDQVEEEIRSQWASMLDRSDYDELNFEMDNYAKDLDQVLPEPVIK